MKKKISKNNILIEETIEQVANMFDYAKNHLHIDTTDFYKYFIESKISKEIYRLNPCFAYGKSSIEVVYDILDICKCKYKVYDKEKIFYPGKEYWVGLIIASYCFTKDISFEDIVKYIDIDTIKEMFYPLHEAPIEKAIDEIDEYIKDKNTNLSIYRKKVGLSQSELSVLSGVSIRSIQLYEQRQKDINKANFDAILKMSNVLGVEPKDLYECANVDNAKLIKAY